MKSEKTNRKATNKKSLSRKFGKSIEVFCESKILLLPESYLWRKIYQLLFACFVFSHRRSVICLKLVCFDDFISKIHRFLLQTQRKLHNFFLLISHLAASRLLPLLCLRFGNYRLRQNQNWVYWKHSHEKKAKILPICFEFEIKIIYFQLNFCCFVCVCVALDLITDHL